VHSISELDRRVTGDEYHKKMQEMNGSGLDLTMWIEQHQQGEGEFRTTLESPISLASRAAEIFERSKFGPKQHIIAVAFSNLRLRRKKAGVFLALGLMSAEETLFTAKLVKRGKLERAMRAHSARCMPEERVARLQSRFNSIC
jgi:hypothetical protein